MNEPLGEREVLCVSQFTLYGDARKGNGPAIRTRRRPSRPSPSMSASARASVPNGASSVPAWAWRSLTTDRSR